MQSDNAVLYKPQIEEAPVAAGRPRPTIRNRPPRRNKRFWGHMGAGIMTTLTTRIAVGALTGVWAAGALTPIPAHAQWQPTRPVEFIIPAGTGGGADLMARTIQGTVTNAKLMKTP